MTEITQDNDSPSLDDAVLLENVCRQYFGLSPLVARRKAAKGLLPVKAFRLSGTRRGPLFVLKSDLAELAQARGNPA